jgi:hypothetical protein
VVPDFLPAFSHALARDGLEIGSEDLAGLTFAIEPSLEVERVLAERRDVFPMAG